MALNDAAISPCFEILTDTPLEEIESMKNQIQSGMNPMTLKKRLAFELTQWLNSTTAAQEAQAHFESMFQGQGSTDTLEEIHIDKKDDATILTLLESLNLGESNADRKRLIRDGAVSINDEKMIDPNQMISPQSGDIIKFGKHQFYKIITNP
jgi:tyrosyl-tRNA synthetase